MERRRRVYSLGFSLVLSLLVLALLIPSFPVTADAANNLTFTSIDFPSSLAPCPKAGACAHRLVNRSGRRLRRQQACSLEVRLGRQQGDGIDG